MESDPDCAIFLYINTASGGGVGRKLLGQEIEKAEFKLAITRDAQPAHVFIYFFDLLSNRDRAFELTKQAVDKGWRTIGVVCGGDGTVMWVVSELHKHHIDPMKLSLGVIPLGTGNDYSQYYGWGKEKTTTIDKDFKSLKKLIRKWMLASEEELDIWDMRAEVFEWGKFEKINKESESEQLEGLVFEKSFCNYFSFGLDGKIGYSFDKHRTTSRLGNLLVYASMGVVKTASKTKTLNDLVEKMVIVDEEGSLQIEPEGMIEAPKEELKTEVQKQVTKSAIVEPSQSLQQRERVENVAQNRTRPQSYVREEEVVFTTRKKKEPKKETDLKKDYYNLLFLNIDSYMAGVSEVWKNAPPGRKNSKQVFSDASSNDGKLQVLSFESGFGLAFQKLIGGFGNKIAQGGGPYYFTFKENREDKKHRTYLQMDGEFIRFTHPKSIMVRKSALAPNGKIRVLRRNPKAEEQMIK